MAENRFESLRKITVTFINSSLAYKYDKNISHFILTYPFILM